MKIKYIKINNYEFGKSKLTDNWELIDGNEIDLNDLETIKKLLIALPNIEKSLL